MIPCLYCDTHAHLSDEAYDSDREEVLCSSLDSGLCFIIDVGTNPSTWAISRRLCSDFEQLYSTVGLHPHDAAAISAADIAAALETAWFDKVVAVGEIGLDFHYDFSPRNLQCDIFEAQLAFAASRKVPSVIHIREAWNEALPILSRADLASGAVVHCFTGTYENARAVLDLGLHLSFTGVLAFPRSVGLRDVFSRLPLDRVFFETDSPYLSPPPKRGRRNSPQNVRLVVEAASRLKGMSPEELAEKTTREAELFFGIEGKAE